MVIPVRRNRPGVREGGIVLVLVSLFLVLLASLALLLVAQTKFLRRIEWSGVTTVRAGLLARSGVERACMESRRGADPVYGGEDYNGDGAWDLSPTSYEQVGQSYRPALFDIDACPVEHALRPSFFSVHDEILVGVDPAPDVNAIDGKPRGFSGRLRGTYIDRAGSRGDTYALKVSLPDGLYVNGGDAAAAWSTGYNLVLAGILTNLAEAIDRSDGADDGVPVDKTDGTRLVFMRPSPGGWTSWDQIRTVALGDSQARLDALKPYLRLTSSVDRKVIAPTAPDLVGSVFTTWADYKMAHTLNGGPIPGPERVGANVVGRAPVYLGWARKQRPVLIALMANLSGIYIDETTATGRSSTDSLGAVKSATLTLDSAAGASWAPGAPTDPCRTAADALFNFAGPLDTWAQWEAFVNGIDFPGLTPAQEAPLQSLLKANFNPNGNLNKFNPNPSRWRPIDKSDMRTYSTEFSLFPQQTEIASAGRILDGAGGLLALRTVEADLAAPRILRIAAQSEFVCDDLGNWDRTGDENATPYRRPGYSVGGEAPFITQGTGDFYTWGQRIDMSGTYSGTWMTGAAPGTPNAPRGLSLQTYPAPYWGAPLSITPATYDGGLQLATIEEITSTSPNMMLRASFDADFDLDRSAAGTPLNQPDVAQAPAGNDLLHATAPRTLYPDGAYSEKDRAPTYLGRGNMHGFHGVLSFWAKPNHGFYQVPPKRGRIWTDLSNHRVDLDPPEHQDSVQGFWILGQKTVPSHLIGTTVGVFIEPSHLGETDNILGAASPLTQRGWWLLTLYWDFDPPTLAERDLNRVGELILNDGSIGAWRGSSDLYGVDDPTWTPMDLTLDYGAGPHRITLGWRPPYPPYSELSVTNRLNMNGSGADATFDEYLIYDMGQDESATLPLAQTRYQAGRYYKGWIYHAPASYGALPDDAAPSYFSHRISLPAGSTLRQARWTFHRPGTLPNDYAEVEIVTADGRNYYWDDDADASDSNLARSRRAGLWSVNRQHWDVYRPVDLPFRLRVLFRRPSTSPADPDDPTKPFINATTPILESPVLDDLTLLYDPPGGVSVRRWQE